LKGKGVGYRVSGIGSKEESSKLKVLWCGQLIKRKALDILLKAVAGDEFLKQNVDITVVGDGPLRHHYEKLAQSLFPLPDTRYPTPDTHTSVTFVGLVSRTEVFESMRSADVLVHTSYREATSNVIPEALSFGLPVICHDISGMAIAINDECGIKVPLKSYDESIIGFRNALRVVYTKLSQSAPSPMSGANAGEGVGGEVDLRQGALQRANELSWDRMAETIATDYNRIVEAK
jgi:glycosyltransferase involved in cell wall biosynthesis